jgi:ADP-ribose pyrophosphatase
MAGIKTTKWKVNEMFTEETIDKTIHFEGRVFTIEEHTVRLHDGQRARREIVRHPGGACVVPVDADGNVHMVQQFRKPYDMMLLEIPAGKLEPGEDPLVCAVRELGEETGFTANNVEWLATVYPSPGYCDETLTIYIATGLTIGDVNPDEGEFLSNRSLPLNEALEMIDRGLIRDAKTQIGLLRAERWLRVHMPDIMQAGGSNNDING